MKKPVFCFAIAAWCAIEADHCFAVNRYALAIVNVITGLTMLTIGLVDCLKKL